MTTKVNDPTVSIVFSFRNEEEVLPELIRRARSVMRELHDNGHVRSWEMIFVDDDSDDRSEQILREHSVGHGDIRVVTTTRPFGKEPCNLAGMKHASGDLVIYLDADLQDPPEIFPQLLAACRPYRSQITCRRVTSQTLGDRNSVPNSKRYLRRRFAD